MRKKKLLILSFSDISADPRVRKQVQLFADRYEVTTAGFGVAPAGVAQHIEIPTESTLGNVNGRFILLRQYRMAYWQIPVIKAAWRILKGGKFEVILSNDLDAVPIALRLKPRLGVHADLHEFYPGLHEDIPAWEKWRKPWISWLCSHYLPKVSSTSTVSNGLCRAYREQFGIDPLLVPNATPYAEFTPREVAEPIRLVHSGVLHRNRRLEVTLEAVRDVGPGVSLDLYLVNKDSAYLAELQEVYGCEWIVFHSAVPYEKLLSTLNRYDLGVHVLAPTNFNNKWALPNKFFDYTQARLGLLIGPSLEMAPLVEEYRNGAVASGFCAADLAKVLRGLTTEKVSQWKQASDRIAHELSSENQMQNWETAISRLAASDSRPRPGIN